MPYLFKMGADPEFSFIFGHKRISANSLISKFNNGSTIKITSGELGWDGASSTGEIRPSPTASPKELCANIGALLKEGHKLVPQVDMLTTNFWAPVGGHIHIEIPDEIWSTQDRSAAEKLTKLISQFWIALNASDNYISKKIRLSGGSYGRLSDYRLDQRRNKYVMEYRAPSAEWIVSPKVCEGTLCYIKTIAHEFFNNPETLAKNMKLLNTIAGDYETLNAMQKMPGIKYNIILYNYIKELKKVIAKMELYPSYKAEIDYILDFGKVYKDKEAIGFNIVKGWGFVSNKPITQKALLNTKDVKEKIKTKNVDLIRQFINISYNNDHKCASFADILAERIIALDYRPENQFFLFGLKKGVDKALVTDQNGIIYDTKFPVATTEDVSKVKTLMNKMLTKYRSAIGNYADRNFTLANMKATLQNKKVFIIGLPYEMRDKGDVNELLKLFLKLEKGVIKPLNVSGLPSGKDTTIPNSFFEDDEINLQASDNWGEENTSTERAHNNMLEMHGENLVMSAQQYYGYTGTGQAYPINGVTNIS